MTSKADVHFEEYREQTRIKHEILSRYLKPYFQIRARGEHKNLIYIDGFAGCGEYQSDDGSHQGSPLRALSTFQSMDVGNKITCVFIEEDKTFFSQLEIAVEKYAASEKGLRDPHLIRGKFEDEVEKLLATLQGRGSKLAPAFLFADPCGVNGLAFSTLAKYLNDAEGEALLFFNYDGVTRIAGLGYKPGATLAQLVGGDARAKDLVERINGKSASEKEHIIVSFYKETLQQDVSDLFCTMFRVEYENRKSTSHYLIHLSKNKTGFRLMKEIMWIFGETVEGKGALALEQASLANSQYLLFHPATDDVKKEVIEELRRHDGLLSANYFYETLSEQVNNELCKPAYKKALLELEADAAIVVHDKNSKPTTVTSRKKYQGQPTLGKECLIGLISRT